MYWLATILLLGASLAHAQDSKLLDEDRLRKVIKDAFKTVPADAPGSKPLPPDFPALVGERHGTLSGPPNESEYIGYWCANRKSLMDVETYTASSRRAEFEKRMLAEEVPALRLICAAIAAGAGSERAAVEILESMRSTDYETVRNTHCAIRDVVYVRDGKPPGWAVELAIAVIADECEVTGLEKTNHAKGTTFRVSHLAEQDANLPYLLGRLKCRQAVPALLDRLKQTEGSAYITALGLMGDDRAVAPLLQTLEGHLQQPDENYSSIRDLMTALGSLKAGAAVPMLVERVEWDEAIRALESIGDARALPALRKLVQDKGVVPAAAAGFASPECVTGRLIKARIALATLEPGDPIPRYCALLMDKDFGEFDRRDVVWRLRSRPDVRAVPHLLRAARSDPSGAVVNNAIGALGDHRFPPSVDALIECFDADFEGKSDWKYAYTPDMFRQSVADALSSLTGQKLPPKKAAWVEWWQANRDSFKRDK